MKRPLILSISFFAFYSIGAFQYTLIDPATPMSILISVFVGLLAAFLGFVIINMCSKPEKRSFHRLPTYEEAKHMSQSACDPVFSDAFKLSIEKLQESVEQLKKQNEHLQSRNS